MYYTLTKQTPSFVLEGAEQVAALRAKVSVAKEDILSIEWHEVFSEWSTMMVRMPGSYMPRWIMAGSYWSEEGWDFIYAHKPRGLIRPILHKVLVVTTSKDKFRRLVIESTKDNANEIKAWWQEKS
jgi:hypothetical protein